MKILGISGLARSGKDSFYELCKPFLDKEGVKHRRMAFADELKEEADLILSKYVGISAFTENAEEKKVIRPLLVTYGTHIRRKINPNCWIEKVQSNLKDLEGNNEFVFITDVRFQNEIEWVHSAGGSSIHVSRSGTIPPNEDERQNDPILNKESNFRIKWNNFDTEDMIKVNNEVGKILKFIL
jgi:hypothetical protein